MVDIEAKELVGKKFNFLYMEDIEGGTSFNSVWPTGDEIICKLLSVGFYDNVGGALQRLAENTMFCISIDMSLYKEETLKMIAEHYEPHVSKSGDYMIVCSQGEELELADDEENFKWLR